MRVNNALFNKDYFPVSFPIHSNFKAISLRIGFRRRKKNMFFGILRTSTEFIPI